MTALTFAAVVEIRGANPFVLVNEEQAASMQPAWRKPMPVTVRINGQPHKPWHSNMMPVGDGNFYLYLHGDMRKASSTKVGDIVLVELDFDEAYQNGPQHPISEDFAAALEQNPVAQANWKALPPSRQKEVLRYFANLKSPEAQARNLTRVMHALLGVPTHFMGRDWRDGS